MRERKVRIRSRKLAEPGSSAVTWSRKCHPHPRTTNPIRPYLRVSANAESFPVSARHTQPPPIACTVRLTTPTNTVRLIMHGLIITAAVPLLVTCVLYGSASAQIEFAPLDSGAVALAARSATDSARGNHLILAEIGTQNLLTESGKSSRWIYSFYDAQADRFFR